MNNGEQLRWGSAHSARRPQVDRDWHDVAACWSFRRGTTYLNHGSFGPSPLPVRRAHQAWQSALYQQPMDFFVRALPRAWHEARQALAAFVGADAQDLIFVENATAGMNIVARAITLAPGDEVWLTDHEYGAVRRIWERRAAECGACVRQVELPVPLTDARGVIDAVLQSLTPRARVLVISHVTSPTALLLPVAEIVQAAQARGITTVVDGPHALAQFPVDLGQLNCDFYTASCHKWLSAPFGSGMLFVAKKWQPFVKPLTCSWGLLPPDKPSQWWEEFFWSGTRDPSAYLTIPDAIRFLEQVGWQVFRQRTHFLARYARELLLQAFPGIPLGADSWPWYGAMAHIPIPCSRPQQLQQYLWQEYGIEVPVVLWKDQTYVRVSCYLYTMTSHLEYLVDALKKSLLSNSQFRD